MVQELLYDEDHQEVLQYAAFYLKCTIERWNKLLLFVYLVHTGKSLSETLILGSTNPQYEKRLFIDLPVQYMKTTSSEHVVYINCSECQNKNKK